LTSTFGTCAARKITIIGRDGELWLRIFYRGEAIKVLITDRLSLERAARLLSRGG
jgi:hypothetical protein